MTNFIPASWIYLERRFAAFFADLRLTPAQVDEGIRHYEGVRSCLNRHYYSSSSATDNSMLTGSWSRDLAVRPSRDIDVLFIMPNSVWYERYALRTGNKHSQLLQEVKNVLFATFPETEMRGDGQAVVVRFARMPVEVVLGFYTDSGSLIICDTEGGGRFQPTNPFAEAEALNVSDKNSSGATRFLIRAGKQWQRQHDVRLRSFMIERLAIEFIAQWPFPKMLYWVDWMVRDFFLYLTTRSGGVVTMPGTGRIILLGDDWLKDAETAYAVSAKAADYEWQNENLLAGWEWQKVFGPMIPDYVF